MILLAVDTCGKEGSLALARVDDAAGNISQLEIIELVQLEGGSISAQLVPQIAALLIKHGMSLREIGSFVVAMGPGSFTGVRVGLAAVKGLAEALEKPIVAVSRLEAVARASSFSAPVVAMRVVAAIDAGRKQAFVGEYDLTPGSATSPNQRFPPSERLLLWQELPAFAASRPVLTTDAQIAEIVRVAGGDARVVAYPQADTIARIGWKKFSAGDLADVVALEANYIRRTDAEILVHGE